MNAIKIPHLVFGLLFLGIAGTWLLGATVIAPHRLVLLLPLIPIVAGVVGLVASVSNHRANRRREAERLHAETRWPTGPLTDPMTGQDTDDTMVLGTPGIPEEDQ